MFKEKRRQEEFICTEKREGHEEVEGNAEGCFFSLKKLAKLALFFRVTFAEGMER